MRRLVGCTRTLRMDHCHALETTGRIQTLLADLVGARVNIARLMQQSTTAMRSVDAALAAG